MAVSLASRRLLLASAAPDRDLLHALWAALGEAPPAEPGWDVVEAAGLEPARFLLQMEPCDAVLLDAGTFRLGEADDLVRVASRQSIPVLYLDDADPARIARALEGGAHFWLPRDLVGKAPRVLVAVLGRLQAWRDLHEGLRRDGQVIDDLKRQVDRLVHLLWKVTPVDGQARWLSQRHVLERLQEEVARTQRYGGELSVVLGEVRGPDPGPDTALEKEAAERIARGIRRCDSAGQYGPHGFLVLLPETGDAGAEVFCRRLQTLVQPPQGSTTQTHFGVAAFSPDTPDLKSLLRQAEEQLDVHKTPPGCATTLHQGGGPDHP